MKLILSLVISLCVIQAAFSGGDDLTRLNRAASEKPDDFETVKKLVEIYLEQRNYASAESILADYMKTDSLNAYAIYLRGQVYDKTDKINDAINEYLRAIELDSTLWQACRDLAYLYDIFSDYETMNRLLNNAMKFAPVPDSLYYDYGYSFDMMGQLDSAEIYYHKAVDFDSLDHQAYLNLGAIMGLSGNLDSAKFLLEKSIAIYPDSPEAFYNLGEVNLSLGHFHDAAAGFQQALALNSGLFAAKKRLGDIYEITGDSGMARIYYQDFIDSAPIIYLDDINEIREKLSNYK